MEPFISDDDARRRYESLRDLARHLVASAEDAEDAVQDTWLARLTQVREPVYNNEGWLRRVLRRKVGRQYRQRSSRAEHERRAARPEAHFPEDGALKRDLASTLNRALDNLREPYRTVLRLRYIEQLSEREICVELDRRLPTVKSQITRGLALLRKGLDGQFDGERNPWLELFASSLLSLRGSLQGTAPILTMVAGGLIALQLALSSALDTRDAELAAHPARPMLRASTDGAGLLAVGQSEPAPVELAPLPELAEVAIQQRELTDLPLPPLVVPERSAQSASRKPERRRNTVSRWLGRSAHAQPAARPPRQLKQARSDAERVLTLAGGETISQSKDPELKQAVRRRKTKSKRRGRVIQRRPPGSGGSTPVSGAGGFVGTVGEPPDVDPPGSVAEPVLPRLMVDQVRSLGSRRPRQDRQDR